MPQGLSSPSVGMVKSTSVVGWPSVSTSAKLGSSWVNGPWSRPCSFIAAKFSPLIQIRSTVPPASRPAAFSAATRATASPVSVSLTWTSPTPKRRCSSSPAQAM